MSAGYCSGVRVRGLVGASLTGIGSCNILASNGRVTVYDTVTHHVCLFSFSGSGSGSCHFAIHFCFNKNVKI